jgi:hypothetical protein
VARGEDRRSLIAFRPGAAAAAPKAITEAARTGHRGRDAWRLHRGDPKEGFVVMRDDASSDNRPSEAGQPDGLCQRNPSLAAIVQRGRDALERKRRSFKDWLLIGEAVEVGQAEAMRAADTNKPTGKRFEKRMGEWLVANSFHIIDKAARSRALECLKHRADIEKWLTTMTEPERFRLNHPDTVLRKWKASSHDLAV